MVADVMERSAFKVIVPVPVTVSVSRAAEILRLTYQSTLRLATRGRLEIVRDEEGRRRIVRASVDRLALELGIEAAPPEAEERSA